MKFQITYKTVSGRTETITVTASSPQAALTQAQLMERERIQETITIQEVR